MTKYIAEQLFGDIKDINTLGFRLLGIVGSGAHDIWLVDIVDRIINGGNFKYPVVNLVCTESVNNLEIVKMCKKRFESPSKIIEKTINSHSGYVSEMLENLWYSGHAPWKKWED